MSYNTELVSNLQKMVDHKNGLRQKLQAVGVDVPAGATLEQLTALIPAGGGVASDVTVTAATLFNGVTAHDKDGNLIVGTALATTSDAGLYDVRKGKTFYDHTGALRTGLQEITDPEDVEQMQDYIEEMTGKLAQVEITPECVLAPYTAIGADGELFQGVAKKSELLTVQGTWTKSITSDTVTMTFPFTETDGFIYIVAAKEMHWNTSSQSRTNQFVFILKDGEVLNSYLDVAGSDTTITGNINPSTGLFTATIKNGSSNRTNAAPAVTHLFAYVIK